ncbi:MAG TPA: glycosyltransferase family 2 protein [Chitinophagaceae bacterium]
MTEPAIIIGVYKYDMKISGFTFVKNAVKYDYPVAESIRSLLPLVDEMVVNLGDSEDNTNELIGSIRSDKIKIIHSVWDKNLREGGKVLAVETDKAMDAAAADADWLFYIQADEVIHEKYLPVVRQAMEKYKDDERVEGLLFRYLHFYGSYNYTGDGRKWYSKEIRVIRNNKHIRAYRDAQGFRKDGNKLNVKQVDAFIYHYGWVRNPVFMQSKFRDFGRHWNDEATQKKWEQDQMAKRVEFDYSQVDTLSVFEGTHPEVMKERIRKADWDFKHDTQKKNFKNFKHRFLYHVQQWFGIRPFEYRNYNKI